MLNSKLCRREELSRLLNSYVTLALGTMVELLSPKLGIGRHNVEEKITLEDLFFLHSMDGGEMVDDEAAAAEARRAQDEAGGVRRHPNMSCTNRLRTMDERMGDMDTNIFKLRNDVEELTAVVSGMSEQYDQFCRELNSTREEQQSRQVFSTASTPSPNPFSFISDVNAGPSTSQNQGNDMDEE
ncbi:hypothetical protein Tco_0357394 [Tanacetum coccineum]